jgi:hypothetical protein
MKMEKTIKEGRWIRREKIKEKGNKNRRNE